MKIKSSSLPFLAALALGASLLGFGCKGAASLNVGTPTPPAPASAPEPPAPPPAPDPPAPPPAAPALKGASMTGAQLDIQGDVEFDTGAATIRDSKASQSVLGAVLKILQDNPTINKLRVEGHTDNVGTDAANQALSEKRAKAVVKWLVDKGIDAKRLDAVGCAAKDPLVPNTSTENKQKNRRTELDVEQLDGKAPDGFTAACTPNPARAK